MEKDICELPVMKERCKSCPFKEDEYGRWLDPELAQKVIDRTLFKSQQICHGTEGVNREAKNRCKGAYDYCYTVYERLGWEPDKNLK